MQIEYWFALRCSMRALGRGLAPKLRALAPEVRAVNLLTKGLTFQSGLHSVRVIIA